MYWVDHASGLRHDDRTYINMHFYRFNKDEVYACRKALARKSKLTCSKRSTFSIVLNMSCSRVRFIPYVFYRSWILAQIKYFWAAITCQIRHSFVRDLAMCSCSGIATRQRKKIFVQRPCWRLDYGRRHVLFVPCSITFSYLPTLTVQRHWRSLLYHIAEAEHCAYTLIISFMSAIVGVSVASKNVFNSMADLAWRAFGISCSKASKFLYQTSAYFS